MYFIFIPSTRPKEKNERKQFQKVPSHTATPLPSAPAPASPPRVRCPLFSTIAGFCSVSPYVFHTHAPRVFSEISSALRRAQEASADVVVRLEASQLAQVWEWGGGGERKGRHCRVEWCVGVLAQAGCRCSLVFIRHGRAARRPRREPRAAKAWHVKKDQVD